MEVGWYLRFGRRDVVEALVAKEAVPQLENMLYVETDWRMETSERDDGVLARFTLKKPRRKKNVVQGETQEEDTA